MHTNVAYTKSFMKFYKIAKKSTPIGTGHKFLIHKVNQGNFKMSKIPKYLYIFSISILFFIQKRNKNHELSINSESSEKKKIAFCYKHARYLI